MHLSALRLKSYPGRVDTCQGIPDLHITQIGHLARAHGNCYSIPIPICGSNFQGSKHHPIGRRPLAHQASIHGKIHIAGAVEILIHLQDPDGYSRADVQGDIGVHPHIAIDNDVLAPGGIGGDVAAEREQGRYAHQAKDHDDQTFLKG